MPLTQRSPLEFTPVSGLRNTQTLRPLQTYCMPNTNICNVRGSNPRPLAQQS